MFSYYGMHCRARPLSDRPDRQRWHGLDQADALKLYGIYTGLVYITPIIGGWLADTFLEPAPCHPVRCRADGRRPVYPGTASRHVPDMVNTVFYAGLGLLIVGNGLFQTEHLHHGGRPV